MLSTLTTCKKYLSAISKLPDLPWSLWSSSGLLLRAVIFTSDSDAVSTDTLSMWGCLRTAHSLLSQWGWRPLGRRACLQPQSSPGCTLCPHARESVSQVLFSVFSQSTHPLYRAVCWLTVLVTTCAVSLEHEPHQGCDFCCFIHLSVLWILNSDWPIIVQVQWIFQNV